MFCLAKISSLERLDPLLLEPELLDPEARSINYWGVLDFLRIELVTVDLFMTPFGKPPEVVFGLEEL